jgi:Leucine-rich repeat (LRR) protein
MNKAFLWAFFVSINTAIQIQAISVTQYLQQQLNPPAIIEGKLDLRDKQLTDLEGLQNIPGAATVTHLYLNNNNITLSPNQANIFNNFPNLVWLSLNHNQIQELPAGIFDNLPQLRALYLHNNLLRELPEGIFDNLNQLMFLNLSNNRLRRLPSRIFDNLTQLQELQLQGNPLQELPERSLQQLDQLQRLYIRSAIKPEKLPIVFGA